MRSSITKSLVAAAAVAAALTFAAPLSAATRTRNTAPVNNGRFEERFKDQDPIFGGGSPVQRIIRIAKKVVVIIQELPMVPTP